MFFKSLFKPLAKALGISDNKEPKSRPEASRAAPVEGAGPRGSGPVCCSGGAVARIQCILITSPPSSPPPTQAGSGRSRTRGSRGWEMRVAPLRTSSQRWRGWCPGRCHASLPPGAAGRRRRMGWRGRALARDPVRPVLRQERCAPHTHAPFASCRPQQSAGDKDRRQRTRHIPHRAHPGHWRWVSQQASWARARQGLMQRAWAGSIGPWTARAGSKATRRPAHRSGPQHPCRAAAPTSAHACLQGSRWSSLPRTARRGRSTPARS